MTQPLIELKNINREYWNGNTETIALKSVDLRIYAGEMIAVVGTSGSGKSTLMNILGVLDMPDSGEYFFRGRNIGSLSKEELADLRCHHFGFVFQHYHLLPHLTALENVEIPAIYSMANKVKRKERAKELLCRLGLERQFEQKPSQLSGGQQQRVSIARALMNGGEIILADEPTGALDSQSSRDVLNVLKELNRQGHTIVLITHDMHIAQVANRVITVKDGSIISDERRKTNNILPNVVNPPIPVKQNTGMFNLFQSYAESFAIAFSMMKAHKVRSFLTMLGIIIGIAAVVCVVALGEGTKNKVLNEFSALGTNTIDIFPGKNWGDSEADKIQTLNAEDLHLLRKQPYLKGATPKLSQEAQVRYLSKSFRTSITGVSEDYFVSKNYKLISGRFFTQPDVKENRAIGILDRRSEGAIFGGESAENKTIFVGDVPILIVGVVESSSQMVEEQTTTILIPYTTMLSRIQNQSYFQQITVQMKEKISPSIAENAIINILTARHGRKDFFTFSSSKFFKSLNRTTQALTLMISSIALISLIVGGIGVMNIMLVSVIERTKEIGIRIAVGAKEKDILHQFLIESASVSLIGGILGILLALLIGAVFTSFTDSIKMQFTLSSFIVAFLCSTLIGVIFGYFPARNAARLKPVEALSRQ